VANATEESKNTLTRPLLLNFDSEDANDEYKGLKSSDTPRKS